MMLIHVSFALILLSNGNNNNFFLFARMQCFFKIDVIADVDNNSTMQIILDLTLYFSL